MQQSGCWFPASSPSPSRSATEKEVASRGGPLGHHSRCWAPSQEGAMSQLTALLACLFLTASAAWATSTPQGQGVPAGTGREIADYYWWIILVVVLWSWSPLPS